MDYGLAVQVLVQQESRSQDRSDVAAEMSRR
jgi:hypothetical protein